jgi:hypothetical protein
MTQYRIYFWEGQRKYCMVMGTTDIEDTKRWLKKKYERFTVEEIA